MMKITENSKILSYVTVVTKILDYSLNSGHCTSENNFKILDSCQPFDLRILESIYIQFIFIHIYICKYIFMIWIQRQVILSNRY